MNMTGCAEGELPDLAAQLRAAAGIAHKRDVDSVVRALGPAAIAAVPLGDDCAALPDGDDFLLFAIEGLLNTFVEREPWFAGYCAMMVNLSDIAAMGGRPLALVDALWSNGADAAAPILAGLRHAAEVYGVPIVGGHSNLRNDHSQLAAAVLGRARRLLTSFDARPGDSLVAAIDLRGRYREPHAYWDASTDSPAPRLRDDLSLLPALAEDGLVQAAKDISMAGAVGTTLMMLECSRVGAQIEPDRIPRPAGVELLRWLTTFPSFGFVLAVAPRHLDEVLKRFRARDIEAACFGAVTAGNAVNLQRGPAQAALWNFAIEPLLGCAGPAQVADPP